MAICGKDEYNAISGPISNFKHKAFPNRFSPILGAGAVTIMLNLNPLN